MLPIHTILLPTDFSPGAQFVLRLGCALARDYGARLYVLHVIQPPATVYAGAYVPPGPDDHEEEWQNLRQLKARDRRVEVEHLMAMGDPAEAILRVAREIRCDLIMMGTHGRTGLGRLLMGSVAETVLRKARCPVLTLRAPAAVTAPKPEQPAEVCQPAAAAT